MKSIVHTCFLLLGLCPLFAIAQPQHRNDTTPALDLSDGLMYTAQDMQQLKKIADSLGVSYLRCPVFSFTAWHQAPAVSVEFRSKGPLTELIAALDSGVALKTLRERYGHMIKGTTGAAVVASDQGRFYAGNVTAFGELHTDSARAARWLHLEPGDWVYRTSSAYTKEGQVNILNAWQLTDNLVAPVIPERYGRLISYTDCLVDTSIRLMLPESRLADRDRSLSLLKTYVLRKTSKKKIVLEGVFQEELPYKDLQDYVLAHYKDDSTVHRLTEETLLSGIEGYLTEGFTAIAKQVIPAERLLDLYRSARVTGFCSMDSRPREHARAIAVLASRTHNWPVFIRAHLNIMNDYMDRMTDGSYAQSGRKTHLRELELINIHTTDLLLGSAMRASNMAAGHYYGAINRYGRALSETQNPAAFESQIKKMLSDKQLDDVNKLLLFALYANYCYSQPTKEKATEKISALRREAGQYPLYIQEGIQQMTTD